MTAVDLRPRQPSMTRHLTGHVWRLTDVKHAKNVRAETRALFGFKAVYTPLLSDVGSIQKLAKGDTIPLLGMSLAPHNMSGVANVCQFSTPECREFCLQEAGNGKYPAVTRARQARTYMLYHYPDEFMTLWVHELQQAVRKYGEIGHRPNVLADVPWEKLGAPIFAVDKVYHYDYTKDWSRESTDRYHLTYSVTERTPLAEIMMKVHDGGQCAVVLDLRKKDPMPAYWRGMPVVDADLHDYRPIDGAGTIAGLRPKGRLNRNSPFVRSAA